MKLRRRARPASGVAEEAVDRRDALLEDGLRGRAALDQVVAVDGSAHFAHLDRNAGACQGLGVVAALVEQRIELGDLDPGGR